ncbi:MAG: ABC transporter substrate-binding protein [Anaerolineae bacterium]|nr:ABC transporter substrate-binding protein [Anaerolineae bacterium]MDW8102642.1 ABC transporter substrate-binding protein [Anaerolineae bacterium]
MVRFIRWQFLVLFTALALLGGILSYGAIQYSTVIVPAPGGRYIEGVAGNPRFLNPLFSQFNELDQDICSLIFNGLIALDDQGKPIPALAERWEISPDGLTYTFHLRRNIRWHDGTPFTAEDVLFTVRALASPEFPGLPSLQEFWKNVEASSDDPYTVRFTLKEPFAPFLTYASIGIIPAHLWSRIPYSLMVQSRFNLEPTGTGPYRLKEMDATRLVLEANPDFYGPKPYLTEIEFRFYPDYESAFEALKLGEVMGVARIPYQLVPEAATMKDLAVYSGIVAGYTMVLLNFDNPNTPFFKEREVRQALSHAIDRKAIIREVLKGYGVEAHSPIWPSSWAYNPEVKSYPYDLEKASALLEKAGWEDTDGDKIRDKAGKKLSFILLASSSPENARLAYLLADEWRKIGVEAIPQVFDYPSLVRDFLYPRNFEAAIVRWEFGPDPDLYPLWHSSQKKEGQNFSGYSSPKFDALLEEARLTPDLSSRRDLYFQFQALFAEEVPAFILYYPLYLFGARKELKGVQLGPVFSSADRFRTLNRWYINTRRVLVSQAEREGFYP